jgi:hypothetical protein
MIKGFKDWKEYGEHSSIPNKYYDSVLGSFDHNEIVYKKTFDSFDKLEAFWFCNLFNRNFKSKVIGKSLLYWKKEEK